jgi:hypothetical protein
MPDFTIPKGFLRLGGVALIVAAILIVAGFLLHPAGEDATHGNELLWVPAHALLWIGYTIVILGWIAAYIPQASRAGGVGAIAIAVLILGTSLTTWIFSSDVTFVPVIAKEEPALFKQIFSGAHLALGIGSVLLWVLGSILFGVSIVRAKVFPSWTGVVLIVGTAAVPVAYFAGVSVKFIAVAAAITASGQIRIGSDLLRS